MLRKFYFILFIPFLLTFVPQPTRASDGLCIFSSQNSTFTLNSDSALDGEDILTVQCPESAMTLDPLSWPLPSYQATRSGQYPEAILSGVSVTDGKQQSIPFHIYNDPFPSNLNNPEDAFITIGSLGSSFIHDGSVLDIHYHLKNAIDLSNTTDSLSWPIVSTFADVTTYKATIHFPAAIPQSKISHEIIQTGDTDTATATLTSSWSSDHTLTISNSDPVSYTDGFNLFLSWPHGFVTPYSPTLSERYTYGFGSRWFDSSIHFINTHRIVSTVIIFCLIILFYILQRFRRHPKKGRTSR